MCELPPRVRKGKLRIKEYPYTAFPNPAFTIFLSAVSLKGQLVDCPSSAHKELLPFLQTHGMAFHSQSSPQVPKTFTSVLLSILRTRQDGDRMHPSSRLRCICRAGPGSKAAKSQETCYNLRDLPNLCPLMEPSPAAVETLLSSLTSPWSLPICFVTFHGEK